MTNPIDNTDYAIPILLGTGVALLVVVSILMRVIFGKSKPKVVVPPLTPEERNEVTLIDTLKGQTLTQQTRLRDAEARTNEAVRILNAKTQEYQGIQPQIDALKAKLEAAKKEFVEQTVKCHVCGTDTAGARCPNCGGLPKRGTIPYEKTDWKDVITYLCSVAEWGDQSEHTITTNNDILLPWAEQDEITFVVGGISYAWGKMEDEDNGGNDWWSYLTYEHPILGEITIINKINSDNDHMYRDGCNDDQELGGGDISELRGDYKKAVRQGLTALYLWMQNEKVS